MTIYAITLPHPSTGIHAGARLAGKIMMGTGALITACGISSLGRDPLAGLIVGVYGAAIGVLGHDLHKISNNLETMHNKSWTGVSITPKKTIKEATNGTILQSAYNDIATLNEKSMENVVIVWGAKPK